MPCHRCYNPGFSSGLEHGAAEMLHHWAPAGLGPTEAWPIGHGLDKLESY